MEPLAAIVARRKVEFENYKRQQAAKKEALATALRDKHRAVANDMHRAISANARIAERIDTETREGCSRRNGAACMDRQQRHACIMFVLKSMQEHFKARYCFPAQETILKFLKKSFGLDISLRTLNYDLSEMEAQGRIKRRRRLSRTKFTSTLYFITRKGARWFSALKKVFGFFTSSRLQNFANNTVLIHEDRFLNGQNQDSGGDPPPVPA